MDDSPAPAYAQRQDTWGPSTYDDEAYPEDEQSLLYGEGAVDPRRGQATALMVAAAVVFLLSLVVLAAFLSGGGFQDALDFIPFTTWIWVFFGALLVILVWLVVLLFTTPARMDEDWYEEEADYPVASYAEPGDTDTISLRCPRCMTIFSLQDPHERPFYHDCPQCQVRGVYSGP